MIDFKKEEEHYQAIMHVKEVLEDPEALDLIYQAQWDLMNHFKVSFDPINELQLVTNTTKVRINAPSIGYRVPYDNIAHIATDIGSNNTILAEFNKQYTYRDVIFEISDYLVADIPKSELALLESLGKIETVIKPAEPEKITKIILCPVDQPLTDIPF